MLIIYRPSYFNRIRFKFPHKKKMFDLKEKNKRTQHIPFEHFEFVDSNGRHENHTICTTFCELISIRHFFRQIHGKLEGKRIFFRDSDLWYLQQFIDQMCCDSFCGIEIWTKTKIQNQLQHRWMIAQENCVLESNWLQCCMDHGQGRLLSAILFSVQPFSWCSVACWKHISLGESLKSIASLHVATALANIVRTQLNKQYARSLLNE